MRLPVVPLVALVALVAFSGLAGAGCRGLLELDEIERVDGRSLPNSNASADASSAPDCAPASCARPTSRTYCAKVARFTASSQVVDGDGEEFCDVIGASLDAREGAFVGQPSPVPAHLAATVVVRAAWSSDALHVHVRVDDAHVLPAGEGRDIWEGDAVEILAAGYEARTGAFSGTADPGAVQFVVAPPASPSAKGRVAAFRQQASYAPPGDPELAVRTLPGGAGYEVEARLPWATLHGAPRAGRKIALSISLDMRDDPNATGREAFSLFEIVPLSPGDGATSCATGVAIPSCDDRLWCSPTLE